MITYRCPACRWHEKWRFDNGEPVCTRCGRHLEPVPPPTRLARPATPTSDQLAIDEELEDFDTWARRLNREGGQAR